MAVLGLTRTDLHPALAMHHRVLYRNPKTSHTIQTRVSTSSPPPEETSRLLQDYA